MQSILCRGYVHLLSFTFVTGSSHNLRASDILYPSLGIVCQSTIVKRFVCPVLYINNYIFLCSYVTILVVFKATVYTPPKKPIKVQLSDCQISLYFVLFMKTVSTSQLFKLAGMPDTPCRYFLVCANQLALLLLHIVYSLF